MKNIFQLLSVFFLSLLSGCESFLEVKSDQRLSVPVNLKDFQAMLNLDGVMNTNFTSSGEVSSDDYYLTDKDYNGLGNESDRRLYTWQPDFVSRTQSSGGDEWYNCYRAVFLCNAVLKGMADNHFTGTEADNIRGQALVFRAVRLLDGAQIWAPAYNRASADKDLGMVLRQDPDMNIPSVRSSVKETYDFIVRDLTEALLLLPVSQPGRTLPTKAVVHGLLAKTYLYTGEYEKALKNAEAALDYNSTLIDFNLLNPQVNYPIPAEKNSSAEVLFWTSMLYVNPVYAALAKISPELYGLYDANDLRKAVFFRKNADSTLSFKGTHSGSPALLTGITTSELYLIAAECHVRQNQLSEAERLINGLLSKRWRAGTFTPVRFLEKDAALRMVLTERRKELVMRGLRWPDIKRLNNEGFNITLIRTVLGENFRLPPNDPRYAIAIPEDVIYISGIAQNPR